jgi:hypothetical protein
MEVVATWVGGPRDGEQIAVSRDYIRIALATPIQLTNNPEVDVHFNEVEFPVVLTEHGYRIYWREA